MLHESKNEEAGSYQEYTGQRYDFKLGSRIRPGAT